MPGSHKLPSEYKSTKGSANRTTLGRCIDCKNPNSPCLTPKEKRQLIQEILDENEAQCAKEPDYMDLVDKELNQVAKENEASVPYNKGKVEKVEKAKPTVVSVKVNEKV